MIQRTLKILDKLSILKTWLYVLCAVFFHYSKNIFASTKPKRRNQFWFKIKILYLYDLLFFSFHTFKGRGFRLDKTKSSRSALCKTVKNISNVGALSTIWHAWGWLVSMPALTDAQQAVTFTVSKDKNKIKKISVTSPCTLKRYIKHHFVGENDW
jgi:hypothetical protein